MTNRTMLVSEDETPLDIPILGVRLKWRKKNEYSSERQFHCLILKESA
jgi:hypothetical protein